VAYAQCIAPFIVTPTRHNALITNVCNLLKIGANSDQDCHIKHLLATPTSMHNNLKDNVTDQSILSTEQDTKLAIRSLYVT
jgi:hypothetical protein